MSRFIRTSLYFLTVAALFTACQKNDFDKYYERPAGLAPPIYQQLQARGNFTNLLAVIDKSGYKDILGKDGSWTLFAANDAAFQKYFTANNISGVSAIDSVTAKKIALFGLVYNPFRKDQLTSSQTSLGLVTNSAFRRQTAYYDFVYKENGKLVVDNGQNGTTYTATVNNNKYIPYFISSFLDFNLLNGTPSDYSLLYPGVKFSGFNVANASVVSQDIPAENGIIHEVDQVLTPLPSIDQYISSNAQYSEFKKLLDKFSLYAVNDALTLRYKTLTGNTGPVYLKTYTGLAFSPNNENLAVINTTSQSNEWSILVPTNQQLKAYTDDILEFYPNKSFDGAAVGSTLYGILSTLVNSHMWTATLWPSRLTQDPNSQKEYATIKSTDVVEQKALSNGMFYGISKVQEANVFRTVYRFAYLNPAYALMTRAIDGSDVKLAITTPDFKYTMFLLNDATLNAAGFNYNPDINAWGFSTKPGAVTPVYDATVIPRLNRLIQTNILSTPYGEFDNLSGEGVAEGYNGEYVKFKAGKIQGSGNVATLTTPNTYVTVTDTRAAVNGRAYYTTTGPIQFADDAVVSLGSTLELLGGSTQTDPAIKASFSHFYNYLLNSPSIYNSSTKTISGADAGTFNTIFVPTNAAIATAVKAGKLPGNTVTGDPNFITSTWTSAQAAAVANFILYSIVNKTTIAVDGKKAGIYPTLLKNAAGDSRKITVQYTVATPNPPVSTFQLLDDQGTVSTANYSFSNNLSNRALIHSINTVLKF